MKFPGETIIGYIVTMTSKHLKCVEDPLFLCEEPGIEGGLLMRGNAYSFFKTEADAMASLNRHADWAKGKVWAKRGTKYSIRPVVTGVRGPGKPTYEPGDREYSLTMK